MPCQHKGCPQTFTTKPAGGLQLHVTEESFISIEIEAMRLHYRVAHLNLKEYLCRTPRPVAPTPFALSGSALLPSELRRHCGEVFAYKRVLRNHCEKASRASEWLSVLSAAGSEVHKILPTEEELKPCKDEQDLRVSVSIVDCSGYSATDSFRYLCCYCCSEILLLLLLLLLLLASTTVTTANGSTSTTTATATERDACYQTTATAATTTRFYCTWREDAWVPCGKSRTTRSRPSLLRPVVTMSRAVKGPRKHYTDRSALPAGACQVRSGGAACLQRAFTGLMQGLGYST